MGRFLFLFAGVGIGTFLILQCAGLVFFGQFSHTATTSLVPKETVKPLLLRRMAVTLQLMISILFIVASLVVMEQMRFVNQKDLGFDPKGLIQLSGFVDVSGKIESTLMQELSALPQVKSFTDTNFKPQHHVDPMAIFTNVEWEGKPLDTKVDFHLYGTDHRFGETFDLKMLMGRWWTEGNELSVVLNESAVRAMGSKASEIIFLFFKEYMRLIVIAGIIAFPISYLVMNYWLQGYAYRIQIQIWWLVGIFITITSMVLGTIREQVCKAANENPSEVIKSQ